MAKTTKDTPPTTRAMSADGKKRAPVKPPPKSSHSIVDQLRQQAPSQHSKRRRNDDISLPLSQRSVPSTTDTSDLAPMEMEFEFDTEPVSVYQPEIIDPTTNEEDSVATENVDNINKDLFCTRVDIRIKVPPHSNPEEKTVQVLQEFLHKLQSYDPKARIAPWHERCSAPPIQHAADFTPRPSELENFFPRIFFKEEGFTWYSGTRLIHSLPIQDLRQDMIRWLKRESHGLFERMLQVADTAEIGWLVYSTWQMEAAVLAQAIELTIKIPIGLRWKQISTGSKDRLPIDQQVKALHVEVALENKVVAQKALLAVYGRKNSGKYPNGIRMRFSLLMHAAHNLNSKAKLERLRSRQQVWSKKYEKGFSWEITQLDHSIGKNQPTLRLALLNLMSKSDPNFPIFHSVDRSNYRESGICFQFLPELAEEARMTISNLVPLMKHKYGPSVLNLFSPSAVERMEGCKWDPSSEMVIGQYDDEITFLDEDDPMKDFVTSKSTNTTQSPGSTTNTKESAPGSKHSRTPTLPTALLHEMDDDSVSTLGNNTHHRWSAPPPVLPSPITQRPHIPLTPNDDASLGSISTLTTRLTTMESQYIQISGAVQDIKTMLAGLAQANHHSAQDESPTNATTAGRGQPSTGGDS